MAFRVLRRRCFLISWLFLGILAWSLPLVFFVHSRLTHELPDNYEEYLRSNDDIGWATYFDEDDDGDVRWKNYRDHNCSWLFGCAYQAHERVHAPKWWLGSNEVSESSASLRAALSLVYMGSSIMFAGILYFGYQITLVMNVDPFQNLYPLVPILSVFAGFSLLIIILICTVGGLVDTAGREILMHGWCGQIGVLLYVTAFFWILFCVIFVATIKSHVFQYYFVHNHNNNNDSADGYQLQNSMDLKRGPLSPAKTEILSQRMDMAERLTSTFSTRLGAAPPIPETSSEVSELPLVASPRGTRIQPPLKSLHQRRWEAQQSLRKSLGSPPLGLSNSTSDEV